MTTPGDDQMERVRRICLALPGASEKLSHGEPTFFVKKRIFAMFSNNHHNDGHVAVWIPAQPWSRAFLPFTTGPPTSESKAGSASNSARSAMKSLPHTLPRPGNS